jgi:hypothetical protein
VTNDSGEAAGPRAFRGSRLADAAALLLIASGAAVYLYAQHQMGELAAGRMRHTQLTGPDGGWNLTVWGNLIRTSRIGIGLTGAGVAIGVASFASTLIRRSSARAHAQEDHS